MKRIEALTPEQEAYLPEFRQRWLEIGICVDPADRPQAENAIAEIYAEVGKKRPRFMWCDSLLAANLGINFFNSEELKRLIPATLRDTLRDTLGATLHATLSDTIHATLSDTIRATLYDTIRATLHDTIRATLYATLSDTLRATLGDTLSDTLSDTLHATQKKFKTRYENTLFWGQHDAYWVAYCLFCQNIGVKYPPWATRQLDMWSRIVQSTCWFWPYEKVCVLSERPSEIHMAPIPGREFRFHLHHDGGPSIKFRDGWAIWSLWGVRVSKEIAETPAEKLDPRLAIMEQNAERRSVICRKIGVDRIVEKLGAKVIHRMQVGRLEYELLDMAPTFKQDRAFWPYLKMPSPSIPGKFHIEGVSPTCRTIEDALLWRNSGDVDMSQYTIVKLS